jgi:hypothetical protein
MLLLTLSGCASPIVRLVPLDDAKSEGVRVRQFVPYEVMGYAVDANGALVLKQTTVESLPHPTNIYSVNYVGALVSSSKFKVSFSSNGALAGVHVETLRTLKDAADAATSTTDQVSRFRQAQQDAKTNEAKKKDIIDQLKAIKDYRDAYKAATGAPAAPGEPLLPDGSKLPSSQ